MSSATEHIPRPLAAEAERFERDGQISAEDSRARIKEEIEKRYILA